MLKSNSNLTRMLWIAMAFVCCSAFTACSMFQAPPPVPQTVNQTILVTEAAISTAIAVTRQANTLQLISKDQAQKVHDLLTEAEAKIATARTLYALFEKTKDGTADDKLAQANAVLAAANELLLEASKLIPVAAPPAT